MVKGFLQVFSCGKVRTIPEEICTSSYGKLVQLDGLNSSQTWCQSPFQGSDHPHHTDQHLHHYINNKFEEKNAPDLMKVTLPSDPQQTNENLIQ